MVARARGQWVHEGSAHHSMLPQNSKCEPAHVWQQWQHTHKQSCHARPVAFQRRQAYPVRLAFGSRLACSWHMLQCRPATASVGPLTRHAHGGHPSWLSRVFIHDVANSRKPVVAGVTASESVGRAEVRTLSAASDGLNVVVVVVAGAELGGDAVADGAGQSRDPGTSRVPPDPNLTVQCLSSSSGSPAPSTLMTSAVSPVRACTQRSPTAC